MREAINFYQSNIDIFLSLPGHAPYASLTYRHNIQTQTEPVGWPLNPDIGRPRQPPLTALGALVVPADAATGGRPA
jgi:hypothetical protein